RKAHVDHVEALLDGPAQPCEEDGARAGVAGAEDAHAVDLALRSEAADDPRARGSVAAEVALLVGRRDRLVVFAHADRDRAVDRADLRMIGLDAAVEDAHANALAGRAVECPV